jgi:hypothetical protein
MAIHHHHPVGRHPPAKISPSVLRLSVWQRLAVALVVLVLVWGFVLSAMR